MKNVAETSNNKFGSLEHAPFQAQNMFSLKVVRQLLLMALTVAIIFLGWSVETFAAPPQNCDSSIDLARAASLGCVSYKIRGMGTSEKAHIEIRNHLNISVQIEIEPGTELVPSQGGVQRLAVTRGYKINIHGHAHNEEEVVVARDIDVACLDISLDAPSRENDKWTVKRQQQVQDFLTCLDDGIQEAKKASSSLASQLSDMRPFLVQLAVWQARGASRQQWIDFFVKYQKMKQADAAQVIDGLKPLLDGIVGQCGSLLNI
jgi:hypothetical protein